MRHRFAWSFFLSCVLVACSGQPASAPHAAGSKRCAIIGHDVSDTALASAAARDRRLFVVTDDSVVACECTGWDLAAAEKLATSLQTENTDAPPPATTKTTGELTCSEPPGCQGFVFSGTARSVYDRRGRRSVDDACIPKQ